MICNNLSELLGLTCYPLNDLGTLALITTPFTYGDGDYVHIYVEKITGNVRFFDDGAVIMHFLGRGMSLENKNKTRFIRNIAHSQGASLNDDGEIEVWAREADAEIAFAKFMATILGVVSWERENKDSNLNISLLIEEVAMYLKAWKPSESLVEGPKYKGVSGSTHKFDFKQNNEVIIAITPHPLSVSAALKKMVDVISSPSNQDLQLTVVLDDREQPKEAKNEGAILSAVSGVLMMSKLQALARHNPSSIN